VGIQVLVRGDDNPRGALILVTARLGTITFPFRPITTCWTRRTYIRFFFP
jgi:hypothetical protein